MNTSTLSAFSEIMWNNVVNSVTYCLMTLAGTSFGQIFIRFLDRCLWVTEKSSQWSLPYHEMIPEENGKSFKSMELIRPLPWLLFFPVLLILRSFRIIWNIGSLIFGYPRIEPSDIVRNVQKTRRRLRTIKISGIKSLRQKRTVNVRPMDEDFQVTKRSLLKSIQLTLSSLSCLDSSRFNHSPPPTRIKISVDNEVASLEKRESTKIKDECEVFRQSLTPDEKSTTESTIAARVADAKRKYTEVNSDEYESDENEDETLNDKIDRLAGENSSDDPDFDPAVYNSESSTSNGSDEEEKEEEEEEEEEEEKDPFLPMNEFQTQLKNSDSNSVSGITFQWKSADDPQNISTCGDSNGKNRDINDYIEEQRDYHSPQEYKSGDDGEVEFYSPISSKSATPERVVSNFDDGRDEQVESREDKLMEEENNGGFMDDGISAKNNGYAEPIASEKAHASKNIGKNQPKPHQPKGKRVIHGNRKKK